MTINQSTNNAESYLVLICRGFFYWGRGVLCVCFLGFYFVLFWGCFGGFLFCFVVIVIFLLLLFFLKIIGVFFSLNLSYLKTVYKICIFFRDIAFFIVIVAIPVFFRLIKILIKLKGLVQTNSVSENTHSDSV